MQIYQRFRQVRKCLKMTQTDFGEKIGKTMRSVQEYERGTRNITDGVLLNLQETFNVNPNWLRTGTGSMFLEEKSNIKTESASTTFVEIKEYPTVKASAGYGSIINEEIIMPYFINANLVSNKDLEMVISVTGNSMSPTLEEGDKILITSDYESISKPKINKIYVIHTDNATFVKRYKQKKGDEYIFSSDNKEYGDIKLNIHDSANRVIGKVKAIVCRDFN